MQQVYFLLAASAYLQDLIQDILGSGHILPAVIADLDTGLG